MKLPQTLIELGKIFHQKGSPLYVVGGYVRNSILGFTETDIDICGPLPYYEVKELLQNSIFNAEIVNEKLGTLLIKSKINREEFEYTTWRKESYGVGGVHSPEKVEFVTDVKQDASRRDFTCNCIYYDVNKGEVVDLFGGVRDTWERVLKTVRTPEQTFADDGLRILRLARMSAELGFSIDEECEGVAKKMVAQLADISQERFNKEIISILFSDYKYPSIQNPNAPKRGLALLSEWGAWSYIFREIALEKGMSYVYEKLQNKRVQLLGSATVIHRITLFTYEILNGLELDVTRENVNKILGTNGLMLSKKEVMLQTELLLGVQSVLKGFQSEEDARLFIQKNAGNIVRMMDLGSILGEHSLSSIYKVMLLDKVPMTLRDLKIDGYDLADRYPDIPKERYGDILNNLLQQCCIMPELNEKSRLLNFIKGRK